MNVLALVTEAYGGRGGIAQYNRDLIRAISSETRVQSVLVLPRHAMASLPKPPNKVIQARPSAGRLLYALRMFGAALRYRPDVLFCGHLYIAPLAFFAAKGLRIPYFVQLHGIEIWQRPSRAQILALEQAALIFCVSRDTRARALRHTRADPNRVVIVPDTFETDFRPGDRRSARVALGLGEVFALLTIGRLDSRERYKGHDSVLRVLSRLPKERSVIYLISGEGDDRPRLEAVTASLGLQEYVRFLGYTPRDKLPDLYRAADLFVMPSSGEGFGIVFLEAMASGTPALGLAVGGAADPLDFGAFGKAVTEAEFEDALRLAVTLPRPDPMTMHGEVSARFGFEVFARQVAVMVKRLANLQRGGRN